MTKVYCPGSTLTALRDVDLAFPCGSCAAVMGASGCADTRAMIAALGLALAYTVIAIASTLVIATAGRRLNGPRCGWRAWRRPGRCLAGPERFL